MNTNQATAQIDYTTKETSAALRKALRAAFPGVKIAVRMSTGIGHGMSSHQVTRRYACKTCGAAAPAGIGYAIEQAEDLPEPASSCQEPHLRNYDDRNQCIQCGEHVADPHAPKCPASQ